jgi:predicted dehydrogenase
MSKPLRIGVLGLTHDHVWDNLPHLGACEGLELAAAADPNQPLLDKLQTRYAAATYLDYREMIDRESLDAVYVYSDNRTGAELATWAAGRGLHVMIEKPMAADLAGAEAILAAAGQSGARIMVNWPFAWWPQLQRAIVMALEGQLGRIWQVRYRAAHAGPKEMGCSDYFCDWLFDKRLNGGGALMDYCCYGANLAGVLLGTPDRVVATTGRLVKEEISVEDNAMLAMSYPRAFALAEASWTQIGKLTGYITAIYGTRATLMVEPRAGGRLWMATAETPQGAPVDLPPVEPHMADSAKHFAWGIATGEEFWHLCRAGNGRVAQEILEAAIESSHSGREVSLPVRRG